MAGSSSLSQNSAEKTPACCSLPSRLKLCPSQSQTCVEASLNVAQGGFQSGGGRRRELLESRAVMGITEGGGERGRRVEWRSARHFYGDRGDESSGC